MSNRTRVGAAERRAGPDDELFALVYDDLKRLAARHLARGGTGQTLQPTALVHEVYLRLFGVTATGSAGEPRWADHRHFFATAALAMRHILIEAARRRGRDKRGGDMTRVAVDLDDLARPEVADDVLALDEALTALEAAEPAIAELVALRYFGGLTLREAAATLGIPPRTADTYWAYARSWLLDHMTPPEAAG